MSGFETETTSSAIVNRKDGFIFLLRLLISIEDFDTSQESTVQINEQIFTLLKEERI